MLEKAMSKAEKQQTAATLTVFNRESEKCPSTCKPLQALNSASRGK